MHAIKNIEALQILDSRGNPTVQVTIFADNGTHATACVPSGASTGKHEALELRDKDMTRYGGKGVLQAIRHVEGPIKKALLGRDFIDYRAIDQTLIALDGTPNKSHLGANAILGVSLACARLAAINTNKWLFQFLSEQENYVLPCPMMNIINGGAHADNALDFQEFMIRPIGAPTFSEALRFGTEIFHCLKKLLKEKGLATSVGDEGGFAPNLSDNEEAIQFILKAIEHAGYKPGIDVTLALDCAASEFYDKSTSLYVEKKKKMQNLPAKSRTNTEFCQYLANLCSQYPIDSIEDGLDENDWEGWQHLTHLLKDRIQIVGDDIFVTNPRFIQKGIDLKVANAILIKLNQIGTLSETLDAINLGKKYHYASIISHRSGETEDSFIADLAVATGVGQIKTGSLSRTDRICKYNRLLAIEKYLGAKALFLHNT